MHGISIHTASRVALKWQLFHLGDTYDRVGRRFRRGEGSGAEKHEPISAFFNKRNDFAGLLVS